MELLSKEDLMGLIKDSIPEALTLEYSDYSGLADSAEEENTELLMDIISMANSGGGTIVIGIESSDGVPKLLRGTGVRENDVGKWMLSTLGHIKERTDPMLESVHIHAVPLGTARTAFVIEVLPDGDLHALLDKDGGLIFPRRRNRTRVNMNVRDIERAIRRTVELDDWIISFITERLVAIQTEPDSPGPAVVLHIVPEISFRGHPRFDMKMLASAAPKPPLADNYETSEPDSGNGYLVRAVSELDDDKTAVSYAAWTIGGNMEAVYFAPASYIAGHWKKIEDSMAAAGDEYAGVLRRIGVPLPWRIGGALIGMQNHLREDVLEAEDLMVYTHGSLDQVQTPQVICYTDEEVRDAVRSTFRWLGEAIGNGKKSGEE